MSLSTAVTSMTQHTWGFLLIKKSLKSLFLTIIQVFGSPFWREIAWSFDDITAGSSTAAFLFYYLFDQLLFLLEMGKITLDELT